MQRNRKTSYTACMAPLLILLTAGSAAATVAADYHRRRKAFYLFKPLTTGLILLLALTRSPGYYQAWICAGIVLSLIGDVFLMLPKDRFTVGLASFLLAHLSYIVAFNERAGRVVTPGLVGVFVVYGILLMALLWPHLMDKRTPVLIYAIVLSGLGWQAGEAWHVLRTPATLVAFTGVVLFILSDSALAWNRFVRPFGAAQAFILSTYYAAQVLIALSI